MEAKTASAPLADVRSAIFLKWMMDSSRTLVPEEREDRIAYPDVARLVPAADPVEFLDRLAAQGVLIKERYQSEVLCPSCGSSSLRDRYTCMFCRGDNLETGDMIEHYACGNTDFESSYLKEGKLICPKCRRELKIIGTDYRRVGKVFKCNDCGRDSSIPRITHTCQKCGTVSTWEQARLRVLYKYRINEEKKKEIDSLTGIYLPLVEFLQKGGFQVESPALLKGESGVEHSFDIQAISEERRTLFDMASDRESVGEAAVIAFFSKTLDVAHDEAVLICVPKASERARGLCKLYGIDLVEGDRITEILNSMATLTLRTQATPRAPMQPGVPSQVVSTPPVLKQATQRASVQVETPTQVRSTPAEADAQMKDLRARIGTLGERTTESKEKASTSELRALHSKISSLEETTEEPLAEPKEKAPVSELRALRSKIFSLEEMTGKTLEEKSASSKTIQTIVDQSEADVSKTIPSGAEQPHMAMEDARLRELEALYRQGKMGEEEYRRNKKRILKSAG